MARTVVPVQLVSRAGVNIGTFGGTETSGDLVNQHQFTNDGTVYLFVRNQDVVNPATITALCPRTVDGLAVAGKVLSIPANGQRLWGPFPPDVYNQSKDDPSVYLDVTDADLRLSCWKLGV